MGGFFDAIEAGDVAKVSTIRTSERLRTQTVAAVDGSSRRSATGTLMSPKS
jgi:hypothetical protein